MLEGETPRIEPSLVSRFLIPIRSDSIQVSGASTPARGAFPPIRAAIPSVRGVCSCGRDASTFVRIPTNHSRGAITAACGTVIPYNTGPSPPNRSGPPGESFLISENSSATSNQGNNNTSNRGEDSFSVNQNIIIGSGVAATERSAYTSIRRSLSWLGKGFSFVRSPVRCLRSVFTSVRRRVPPPNIAPLNPFLVTRMHYKFLVVAALLYLAPLTISKRKQARRCYPGDRSCLSDEVAGAAICPTQCRCSAGIVDCRDRALDRVPLHLPSDTAELRLEQNQISEVPSRAFSPYRKLRRIDLSNNQLSTIAGDAFHGLKALSSLVLYGNKIAELETGVFAGLTSLQLLLLNANMITCLRRDVFGDLRSLNLLSLYDNNIKTIQEGTFSALPAIQTLHLGRNPFVCDCSLQWLSEYLERNPIETSGARCNLPRALKRRKLTALAGQTLKCTDETVAQYAGACVAAEECPRGCSCRGTTVDCTAGGLTALPDKLPPYTTDLLLSDNELSDAVSSDAVKQLSRLRRLVMANNQLRDLPPDLFTGLTTLVELDLSDNQLTRLTSDMFLDLPQLTTLILHNNRLNCVAPGAFSSLPSLQHIGLEDNPLICNCHLGWMADWLRLHSDTQLPGIQSPTCYAPHHLRNKPVTEIPRSAFSCRPGESSDCLGSSQQQCPEQCACEGTVVRCSRGRLSAIPAGIPSHTTELYLDVNQITEINTDKLSHLKALTRLDLSNNQIAVLQNNTFSRLFQLSTLIVSFNKLQCMQRDALAGLTKLRILSLHGNDISRIPEGTFRNLDFITHIALGANPLYCDCELAWLSDWVKVDFVEPGIARCAEPAPMRDKLVLTTPTDAFACTARVPTEVLAKCDLCYTEPCRNGATCHSLANRSYECVCPPAYHGTNCQYKIDACYGNPCENLGTCKVVETGRFSCHCPDGFQGIRCEENIDDCAGHKCENDAKCVDLIMRYRCDCPAGYTGEYCEKKIDFCSKEFNPCKNGGSCVDHFTHYECRCPLGFSGDNCTIDINDCENNLCQNGATCIDGANEYTCKCSGDFSGKFCEAGPAVFQQTSPCQQNDCQNGICFVPPNSQDYVCKCSPGFSGKHCEYLTRVRFSLENSFLSLDSLKTKPSSNVTLYFRTTEEDGIVLYVGDIAHLAVELFRGRIRVSYDVGNHPISNMFSYEVVSDGRWHRVELLTHKQNFTLTVDNGRPRSIVNDGLNEYLETDSPLYLGGLPREVARNAVKMWHLRDTDSFMGCMERVYIGGRLADLSVGKQHQITPGCGGEEEVRDQGVYSRPSHPPGGSLTSLMHSATHDNCTISTPHHHNKDKQMQVHPPARDVSSIQRKQRQHKMSAIIPAATNVCENHQCKRGRCKPKKKRPDQYKCRCRRGWGGKFCDQVMSSGPTCRKEQFTEYYVEHMCRSRKPIKNALCSGTCNNDCCKPRRTKLRKVRLICNDGTSYTKEIEVIRKCQCTRRCY